MTKSSILTLLLAAGFPISAVAQSQISEGDYFGDLPEVLTVTRLAQPLSETPGAVTIIDRETIRRSGARTLVEVLRLVPGYLVAGFNGAHPNAAYHAPLDDYGTRNLVMIDGRAIYSSLYLAGTYRGMTGVLLDDIERIEVLRGSNSAAYGANAMFGVINVITRHAADTPGGEVTVTRGGNGVGDAYARIGWGGDTGSFRLSAGRRSDTGYRGAADDSNIDQMHFRADLHPANDQELTVAAGMTEAHSGDGFANHVGNPERTVRWRDVYLRGQWRKQLAGMDEIKLAVNFDEENIRDRAPYAPLPGIMLDFGGRGRRLDAELQHQIGLSDQLRAVWGIGYKYEVAYSQSLFDARSPVSYSEKRLFGNLAWQPNRFWTINAGGYWGSHSDTGMGFSPRLMANLHLTPDHTLRAGAARSLRPPSLFEMKGDVRYYLNGALIGRTTTARGNVSPEQLQSREIGYFGNLRDWRMTLDVRVFHERMRDTVTTNSYDLPPAQAAGLVTGNQVEEYVNGTGLHLRGGEYQLRWKPLAGTEVWLNQAFLRQVWDNDWDNHLAPRRTTMLALFQKLPLDLDFSLMWHATSEMTWRDQARGFPAQRRVDARLALPFRIGSTRAEAAVTLQAANGSYLAFYPSIEHRLMHERRAFGTLRLEF